jgi:hypothetical protein
VIRKRKYIVGEDLKRPANPERRINHPTNATPHFCTFPKLKGVGGRAFAGGLVYLKEGRHNGPNNGFGVLHIWAEHFTGESEANAAEVKIAEYVATILMTGSSIHHSADQEDRALIWGNSKGLVMLEERAAGEEGVHYSVVTAFRGRLKGTLIGKI